MAKNLVFTYRNLVALKPETYCKVWKCSFSTEHNYTLNTAWTPEKLEVPNHTFLLPVLLDLQSKPCEEDIALRALWWLNARRQQVFKLFVFTLCPQSDSSFSIQWVIGQCKVLCNILYENCIEKILQYVSTTEDAQKAIFNYDSTSFKYPSIYLPHEYSFDYFF